MAHGRMQGLYQKVEWRRVEFISHAHQKSAENTFPNLRRTKNSGKWPSQDWEDWETVKNSCPKLGKNEKHCRQSFPPLGNRKMLKINSSLVSEMQKTRKNRLLRKKLNPESLLSDFRGSVLFWYTLFYLLIADLLQSLFDVGNDVIHIFNAHREAD